MVTNLISRQELGNPKRQSEFYEATGNRFAILLFTDPNSQADSINNCSAKVFQKTPTQ